MHVPKFAYRYAWFACRRTRGEVIVDNGPHFLKMQKLALPLGIKEGGIAVKEKKGEIPPDTADASTTMIIASYSFHGTAHDHPKISVCNSVSSFLAPVAIRRAFLPCFSSAFRPSGEKPLAISRRSRESRCIFWYSTLQDSYLFDRCIGSGRWFVNICQQDTDSGSSLLNISIVYMAHR